jgi:hypothetical protein
VPAHRYTEEQFRTAVADPEVRTLADLCRALGIVPRGANYETVRLFGRSLDIDVDHELAERRPVPTTGHDLRSYTDQQLREALADSDINGYPALCRRLGLQPHPLTHRRLDARARALGLLIPSEWSRPGPRAGLGRIYAEAEARDAVASSLSQAAAIRRLGQQPSRSSYARLRRSIQAYDLDTSHFRADGGAGRLRRRPLEEILVPGRFVNSSTLRHRLIEEGVKSHACEECRSSEWHGAPIPLELDHIDGDRSNNRLENLRLLCPNCHALTPTYRGRNIGRALSAPPTEGPPHAAPS